METRYGTSKKWANTMTGGLLFGYLLMLMPLFISGSFIELMMYLTPVIAVLIILWLGTVHGTYITIDENNNLHSIFLFRRLEVTHLSDIISLDSQRPFLGLFTGVVTTYRDNKGRIVTKGLITRDMMNKNDCRKLIERIHEANPNIRISDELFR